MKQTSCIKGNLLILETAFLWSFLGILTKSVTCGAMTVIFVTSLLALGVMMVIYRDQPLRLNRMTLVTGLVTALTHMTFLIANKYTTVSNAIVLQYCSPVFVALYYRFFQKRRLRLPQLAAIFLCFAGLVIFFFDQLGSGNMTGNVLALLSGVLFAGQFYLSALPGNDPVSAGKISHLFCLLTGAACVIPSICKIPAAGWGLGPEQFLPLMAAGILCNGLANVTYASGIRITTALSANMIAMTEVIMAPLWSFLLFHETFGAQAAVGAGLMVGAITYETWYEGSRSS